MKILYVNDFLVYAGAEKLVTMLTNTAVTKGNKATIAAPFLNRQGEPWKPDIIKEIQTEQPDIIHFHNITHVGLDPMKYCIQNKIPAVWTVHDWYPICKLRKRINPAGQICNPEGWEQCIQCPYTNLPGLPDLFELRETAKNLEVITISNAQRIFMADFGYDPAHISVVKNGVDLSRYQSGEDQGYVFSFGVMRYEKAVDWHLASAEVLPYKHVLAGGQLDFKLDVGNAKTTIVGFLPDSTLNLYLSQASLVQVPARWHEPCGLTILESLASGRPVISVALGGIPEYIQDGETGFLAEPGDFIGFIDLTHYLMENEELRHQMGKNAQEASSYFSLERVWHDYETIYKKALS